MKYSVLHLLGAHDALKPKYTLHQLWCLSRCASCPKHRHPSTHILILISSLVQMMQCPWLPKLILNFDSSGHRTTSHFVWVHFKWAAVLKRWWCFWIMFTYGFFLEWQGFNLCPWVVQWTVFTGHNLEVFLSPRCDFHDKITPVVHAVPSDCPKITGIQYWLLRPCSQWVSESFNDFMCCTDDGIFKVFIILHWMTFLWNFSTICGSSFFLQIFEPLCSWEALHLQGAFLSYTQSHHWPIPN